MHLEVQQHEFLIEIFEIIVEVMMMQTWISYRLGFRWIFYGDVCVCVSWKMEEEELDVFFWWRTLFGPKEGRRQGGLKN